MTFRWLLAVGALVLLFGGFALGHMPLECVAIYYEALTAVFLAAGGMLALTKRELKISVSRDHDKGRDYVRGVISNDERLAGYFILLAAMSGLCMSSVHLYETVKEHHERAGEAEPLAAKDDKTGEAPEHGAHASSAASSAHAVASKTVEASRREH